LRGKTLKGALKKSAAKLTDRSAKLVHQFAASPAAVHIPIDQLVMDVRSCPDYYHHRCGAEAGIRAGMILLVSLQAIKPIITWGADATAAVCCDGHGLMRHGFVTWQLLPNQ
jgi:hypothetical protein